MIFPIIYFYPFIYIYYLPGPTCYIIYLSIFLILYIILLAFTGRDEPIKYSHIFNFLSYAKGMTLVNFIFFSFYFSTISSLSMNLFNLLYLIKINIPIKTKQIKSIVIKFQFQCICVLLFSSVLTVFWLYPDCVT